LTDPLLCGISYNYTLHKIGAGPKLCIGQSVIAHQSKDVFTAYTEDLLLATWGLHHLHLSTELEENGKFVRRADYLLFVYVEGQSIYTVDIRPHKEFEGNVNLVWYRKNLLKNLQISFPEVLDKYQLNGVLRPTPDEELTDLQHRSLRKAGITTAAVPGEFPIIDPGGGISTAGSSLANTMRTDLYMRQIYGWEAFLNENPKHVLDRVYTIKKSARIPELKLILSSSGKFEVIDTANNICLKL